MSDIQERLRRLSPEQRALVLRRLGERRDRAPAPRADGEPPLTAVPRDRALPLSGGQRALWFLDQLGKSGTAYHIPSAFRLRGPLDVGALERALAVVVARHEILRTTFRVQDGEPVQVVAPPGPVSLPLVDLSAVPAAERDAALAARITAELARPFDLARGPLERAVLFRLGADEHVVLSNVHHIVFDGWSVDVFQRDVAACYDAYARGATPALPPLPLQYADFAAWQAGWLAGPASARQLAYWTRQLSGMPPVLELPGDVPRAAVSSQRGVHLTFDLGERLGPELQAVSLRLGATRFMTALAAFAVLLWRWTGRLDLGIASPIAGRHRREVEGLVGYFVNTLPLRIDLSGDPAFATCVARARQVALDAFAHADVPFDRIVEALRVPRDPGRNPLVQIAFSVFASDAPGPDAAAGAFALRGLAVEPLALPVHSVKTDLTFSLEARGPALRGAIEYATELFSRATIDAFIADFRRVLEAALAHPEAPISAIVEPLGPAPVPAPAADDFLAEIAERSNLTRMQLLIWVQQRVLGDRPLYNLCFGYRIAAAIDGERFRRAFQVLVDSSDALRTVFEEVDGVPRRRVLPRLACEVPVVDLSGDADPEQAAERLMAERAGRVMDLSRCAFDSVLARLGPDDHVWIFTGHHLIADLAALTLIYRRMSDLYERALAGDLPARLPLPPYEDYVRHERGAGGRPGYRDDLAYWQRRLARPREPVAFYRRAAHGRTTHVTSTRHALGRARSEAIRALAARPEFDAGTPNRSLFTLLLAFVSAYLYRTSGARRIAFGAPVHNRHTPAFRDTIGLFMDVRPVEVEVGPADSVRSLAGKIARSLGDMLRHGNFVTGNSRRHRAWDLLCNLQTFSFGDFAGAPVRARRMMPGHEDDALNVNVVDYDGTGDYELYLDMNDEVFGGVRGRVAGHVVRVIDACLADPERAIDAIDYLAAEERHQLVGAFNAPVVPAPARDVPARFQAAARRAPGAVAVVWRDETLTYGELEARSRAAAHHLRARGVGPEVRVGVLLERGVELIVWILGVLRAGGVVVPMDPELPPARIAYMAADSGAAWLVTRAGLAADRAIDAARIVTVEDVALGSAPDDPASPMPHSLAYVMYTSGSTGLPKGVMVTHGGLASSCAGWEDAYRLPDEADAHLQMASVSFDVFMGDLSRALGTGGRLVLCPREWLLDGPRLAALIRAGRVRCAEFVPAVLRNLAAHLAASGERLDGLRLLIAGSDAWYGAEYRALRAITGASTRLINSYGLTEASIDSTWFEPAAADVDDGMLPIGRPFPNVTAYVVDGALRLVPIGVAGELLVGGAGLARGYANRPGLTAERFVADPFGSEPGARLYRTGDLARLRPDGVIELLGRVDDQVKLNGVRIEPGEVEAVLAAHPSVREAAVGVTGRAPARLVAFVVPAAGAELDAGALRRFARERLADAMVPSAYITLAALPLTANGKVDRRALAALDTTAGAAATPAAPATEQERRLAALFEEVLGVSGVGAGDDFFALGGHSLLATRLVSRAREAFEVELPLRSVFEESTVAGLAARIERQQRERDAGARAAGPRIARVSREGELPISFAQQRLAFLAHLDPASAAYLVPVALRLEGALDVEALRASLDEIVRRHEVLRTAFVTEGGRQVARVARDAAVALPVVDLGELPAATRMAEVETRAAVEAERAFDLGAAPLLRATLLRLAPDDHVLLVTTHHIVTDGWSTAVFVRELTALYTARARGHPAALPELPVQYADYAAWQRARLTGATLDKLLGYWTAQLAGLPPVLELPWDRPRPSVLSPRGAALDFSVPADVTDGLRRLADRTRGTLFMVLLAGYAALLARYSGRTDVVVGTPIANRTRPEIEALIGCFVNTLALRVDAGGNPSFAELVERVRGRALDAYAHQDLPFERLVDALGVERSLGRAPVVQAVLALQNAPQPALALGDLRARVLPTPARSAKYDLTVSLEDGPAGLRGVIEYSTDLFERATVERLAEHFRRVLAAAAATPHARLSALPIVTEPERRQAFRPAVPAPPTVAGIHATGVHELVAAQARRRPGAVAVVGDGQSLTYAELDARANRLARHLVRLGVGPDRRVGIAVERTADMVVGLLAILKAGGAYVPLDPGYPAERLAYLVTDAGVDVVLTQSAVGERLPATRAARVMLDGDGAAAWATESPEDPGVAVAADTLAYVIHTSGSTGQPKGVMVTHGNVVRLLSATEPWFGFGPADVWTCFHSYAFDFSVWELWGALAYGGRVVVVPWATSRAPEAFHALLAREGVTVLNQTPSAFQQLVRVDEQRATALALRLVIFGGEALEPATLAPWLRRHGDRVPRLVNMYGITETTVHVTYRPIGAADASREHRSPIGVPIPDLELYVLDPDLGPCPPGVAGELYVGGAGLARGYLGRPGLTAERFVAHPFGDAPGARLYRSGDVARALPDGGVEYLGRIDAQVKIRGFRIELAEVEAALARHPDVRSAAVVAREDRPGDKRLVAYVVPAAGGAADAGALRRFLAETLPDYMLPAAFVPIDALPLTPNGKLDRQALPEPLAGRARPGGARVAPRTPVERALATIWAEVLDVPEVGVDDNFFELGGDSIVSLQIVARAAQAGLTLAPRDLFLHQTVERLALVAGAAEAPGAEQGAVTGEVPLTAIQRWFVEHQGGAPDHYNQAVLLVAPRELTRARLEPIVDALLRHHDALRLRLERVDGGWRQRIVPPPGEPLPVSVVDLSGLAPERRREALEARARAVQASLDLARGPIVRAVLFELGPDASPRLLLVAHHLAVDVVSWRIVLEDLARAFEQLVRGEPIALPPKTTSFKAWAEQVVAHAGGAALRDELPYWQAALPGDAVPLPRDHGNGAAPATIADAEPLTTWLGEDVTAELLREARRAYRTNVEEVLLAALALGFRRWTGAGVLLVDLETHGRESIVPGADLSRTVGWFTGIVPVALRAAADGDPGATLAAIKEHVRRLPHRGIGHGLLRYLASDSVRLRDARPEVSLNYVGQLDQAPTGLFHAAPESAGLTQSPLARRDHLIDVIASIAGGRLRLDWVWSRAAHERATVERVAGHVRDALAAIAAHCRTPGAGRYTPSDFPDVTLTPPELDALADHARAAGAGEPNLEAVYPLSPTQEGMLYESLAAPGTGRHVEQGTFVIDGALDLAAFDRAWQQVVARHAVFRTRFVWADRDEPLQAVLGRVRLPIRVEDWHGAGNEAERCAAYLAEDRRRGFDLGAAPLVRVTVMRLGETRHRVAWTFHHILMDGWCLPIVMRDFLALYRAELAGGAAALPAVRPFADYVAWLRRQDVGRAEAYWRGALAGARDGTPPGRVVGEVEPVAGERYGEVAATLTPDATAALVERVGRARLTMSALVQGAWALLLGRYAATRDVVFGVTVSGRPPALAGAPEMVGPFLNTVPLRVRVGDGDAPLWPWLAAQQAEQLERGAYEHCSAGQIHQWTRAAGGEALYDSVLVFENYPVRSVLGEIGAGLPFTVREPAASGARTASAVTLMASAGPMLELRLVHDRARVADGDAHRMARHLVALLARIAEDPAPALGSLAAGVADGDIPRVRTAVRAVRRDAAGHVAPRTPAELRLATLWETLLGVHPIGVRDDFFDLGGHSLLVVRLVKAIEETFGRRLPLSAIFAGPTVERLADLLRRDAAGEPWSPLVTIQPGGDARPLFCVHPLGGNVVCYGELARRLDRDRPVYGLMARGFEPGQVPHRTLGAMAAEYVESVRRAQPAGPYLLLGWSFGGFVALEMANQLRALGETVALLGLLDTPHPSAVPPALRRTDRAGLLASVFGPALPLSVEELRRLDEEAQLADVLQRARAAGVVPPNATPDEMRRWFDVCWTNHGMDVALPTFDGSLVLFRAREEAQRLSDDPALGWPSVACGRVDVRWVDGMHENMLEPRHVARLAGELAALIRTADAVADASPGRRSP